MKKNMGRLDRTFRLILALVIAGLLIARVFHGTLAVILAVLAVVLVITTLVSYCPLYVPLKVDTKGKGGGPRIGA
jgi:hypothetical protein